MPRQSRVVAVDVPHHITHRGNNRQDVFLSDEDRRRYQQLLADSLAPCQAELLGWCWMSNHVHLIVVPRREDSLARLVRRTHSAYTQEFNRRRSRDGHLWRSRFYSCALGPNRLQTALLYVDLNPVRAGMTGEAVAWEWSSARAHIAGRDETGLLAWDTLAEYGVCANWAERLKRQQAESTERELRRATLAGIPFADPEFRLELERKFERDLEWRPRGRSHQPKTLAATAGRG
ncbi:MAG: transposase [Acidobacteria bacterium]|nr:transposase [Acidobacteriota bacterium]